MGLILGLDEMRSPVFWRDVIGEVFCSALLLFSLTCNYVEFHKDFTVTPTHAGLVMGLTVVALIETFGHLGGAFMNPAVTFTMMCRRELSPIKAVIYTLAQCAGGAAGSGLVFVLTAPEYRGMFRPFQPAVETGEIRGMFIEAVLTFTLCMVAQGVTDPRRPMKCSIPGVPIGFTVGINIMIGMTYTGAAFNPIIALGPAVITGNFHKNWIYWAGPYLGACAAFAVYKGMDYVGHRYRSRDIDSEENMEEVMQLLQELRRNRKERENNNVPVKVSSL